MTAAMKQRALEWVAAAVAEGARQRRACAVLGVSARVLRRWRRAATLVDQRKGAAKVCPQALSEAEQQRLVDTCNQPEYRDLPPSQIVPRLADAGVYLASESSFYRVLRARNQDHPRGRAKPPRKVAKPRAWEATEPKRVWTWDISAPWRRGWQGASHNRLIADRRLECRPARRDTRRKGAAKLCRMPTAGCHQQSSLNCTGRRPFPYGPGYHSV